MLCDECEQRFSQWENAFAEGVFRPSLADPRAIVSFDGWMSRFAASLLWRVVRRYQLLNLLPIPKEAFESAELMWREFLLGRRENVADHELHLLPLEAPESIPGDGLVRGLESIPSNWSRYSLTTMAYDLLVAEKHGSAFVFVKLPRLAFFGVAARGKRFPLIRGTKLPMRKGRIEPRIYKVDVSLMNYLLEKAREAGRLAAELSAEQKLKIQAAVRDNPARFRNSESYRAIEADARLFGDEAFTQVRSYEKE